MVFSCYDFGAERKKHTAFEVLSARVKLRVRDKAIVCKVAPPSDELDKIFIWCDSPDHYQVRLRNQPLALELKNLNELAAAIKNGQKQ